jgi:hypothetical protein
MYACPTSPPRAVANFDLQKCREQFCPQHRFPADHHCAGLSVPSKPSNSVVAANINAAGAAIRKTIASSSTPSAGPSRQRPAPPARGAPSKTAPSSALPFSRTDRCVYSVNFHLSSYSITFSLSSSNAFSTESHASTNASNEPSDANSPINSIPNNATSTNGTASTTELPLKSSPEPVIDAMGFVPPMLFASA